MQSASHDHRDFFISYNSADVAWAEWIASKLEPEYTTILQAWDFEPGSNFVLEMQRATQVADRTIMVLSPSYLGASFPQPEWAAAFAHDPEGFKRTLVPVRVEECNPEGLLKSIVYIDLVGLNEQTAAPKLLGGLQPGRKKPLTPPPFPGRLEAGVTAQPSGALVARQMEPLWEAVSRTPEVKWRADLLGNRWNAQYSGVLVELHLVPLEAQRVEVQRLSQLGDELVAAGRQTGLFTNTQSVNIDSNAESVTVRSRQDRSAEETGLAVTRTGQRSLWLPLPNDTFGAVLDPLDLAPRLAQGLRILEQVDVRLPKRFAVTAAMAPVMMLTVGGADVVGRRSSAQMAGFGRNDVQLPIDDSVASSALSSKADQIAGEIAARLVAHFSQ